jgi:predicted ATPase/DNA-binding SARP family transcriptional activator
MLDVRLLGAFEITQNGKAVKLTSRPAQSLFAYLILTAGTPHRREKLAGMLWPDSTEASARDYLRHGLWRIRKSLGDSESKAKKGSYILADDLNLGFNADSEYSLDIEKIEKVSPSDSTIEELMGTILEYGGELLPGFYDEWVQLERDHIHAIYEQKISMLIDRLKKAGRWKDVLEWAEKWISFGQKPEAAYRALMTAHAALRDGTKAVSAYQRCVNALREFDLEPSEETQKLYENIKVGKDLPNAAPSRAKKSPKQSATSNVPVPLTSFIGRENELKEISKSLTSARLVTLTGSGGVGKTRLAIQTATNLLSKFKDGVFWVDLASLSDENLIPQEIAQSLGLFETGKGPLIEVLKNYLKVKDSLIVFDNCEHLITPCARCIEQLLAHCPKLKILATSIEGLGLFSEKIWQVPSLPLPERKSSLSVHELQKIASLELFAQRAEAVNSDFRLTDQVAKSVAQICQRLDGIPLAIELAAARIKVLSVDEIASRLDDRFSLLTSGSRTSIPRHQTLRATIDWSYDLLTEPEQTLFRRLAVFNGGLSLQAAEVVCAFNSLTREDILALFGRLVDKSLVIVEAASPGEKTRYHLLETIRQYGFEKLAEIGEVHEIRNRHLEYYINLAEQAEPEILGPRTAVWFNRLDKELDNIRAAMEWATDSGKAVAALRIAGPLVYFWFAHSLVAQEWNDRVQQALTRPEGMEPTLARAKALNGIGFIYWANVAPMNRRPQFEEALKIARDLGDQANIAMALRNLGLLENIQGNYSKARSFLEQSQLVSREMGVEGRNNLAWTLLFLGELALNQDQMKQARQHFEESAAILRELENVNYLAYAVRRLAHLSWLEDDKEKAIRFCRESLTLNHEVGDPRGVIACLAGFVAIALLDGNLEKAAILKATIDAQMSSSGIQLLYIDAKEYQRNIALLGKQLSERQMNKFRAKGQAMTIEEAISFALEGS